MGFSIGDRLFNFVFNQYQYPYQEQYHSKKYQFSPERILWLVFLPWKISLTKGERLCLIPKQGQVLAYEQPKAMVNHNPQEALRVFQTMLKIIQKDLTAYRNYDLKIIAYSAGNGFGFYLANHLPVKKFISVVTGANLGETIFQSIATPHIKKKCLKIGLKSPQEYDKLIQDYIPQGNLKNISAHTIFYLAKFDEYFGLYQGLKLAQTIKKQNPQTTIKILPFGHCGTVLYFAFLNLLRRNKHIYQNKP